MTRKPSYLFSFLTIALLVGLIAFNSLAVGVDVASGSNNVIILVASAIVVGFGIFRYKFTWKKIEGGIIHQVSEVVVSLVILLLIGGISGTWMISGIVPMMTYYGVKLINPHFLLVSCTITCALVSLITGSSWTTVATIGIAFIGIGRSFGIHEGWVAGAIISGAYFGDKISPLSDTTNLAAIIAGSDLMTHVKYMIYTTIPSLTITLIIYFIANLTFINVETLDMSETLIAIQSTFNITPWLLIVPAITIILIYFKVPTIMLLFIIMMLGAIAAVIFQPEVCMHITGSSTLDWKSVYSSVVQSISGKIQVPCTNPTFSSFFTSRGMEGMLPTVMLIVCAMVFGGTISTIGVLDKLSQGIQKMCRGLKGTIVATALSGWLLNAVLFDQYLAVILNTKIFKKNFEKLNLKPEVLSRSVEDSTTVTSVLVPWNTCGLTQSTVLGVSTFAYFPFAIFCWISPITTVVMVSLRIKLRQNNTDNDQVKG